MNVLKSRLARQLFGRFLRALNVSFWVMVISFMMIRFSPGDPAIARLGAGADPAAIDALRKELKLDVDRKSTRLNSSHVSESRMPSSA